MSTTSTELRNGTKDALQSLSTYSSHQLRSKSSGFVKTKPKKSSPVWIHMCALSISDRNIPIPIDALRVIFDQNGAPHGPDLIVCFNRPQVLLVSPGFIVQHLTLRLEKKVSTPTCPIYCLSPPDQKSVTKGANSVTACVFHLLTGLEGVGSVVRWHMGKGKSYNFVQFLGLKPLFLVSFKMK